MFLGVRFKKMCGFISLLFKFNMYVLSLRFKESRYSKNIIMKMDNFHLLKKVFNFLFHTKEAIGNEIYKEHDFF
jgi:hypothetical protein